ncbi:FliM/FliN family flagellar motor switch protein [Endozoicomonas sp.]|uniref:FliM/FliN family flagellar motor switch protein n=1 Tax=Endozoicomonas sp. TaxID=1892382 RepID=UPI00383A2F04
MTDTGKAESQKNSGQKTGRPSARPVIETSVLMPGQEGPPAPRQKQDVSSGQASPGSPASAGTEPVTEPGVQPSGTGVPPEARGTIAGQSRPVDPESVKPESSFKKAEQDSAAAGQPSSPDLSLVGAVPVTLTLNVGSKRMMISDILKLQQGAIVRFDRREHDPLDVRINGTLFARGEVVLLGDHYGLRILEIL